MRLSLSAFPVFAGLLALGCSGDGQADADGSTLTVLYQADERLFGPYWDVEAQFLLFLPLFSFDENGETVGRLAEAWEHSPDYRVWTIRLRRGVRWHDGVPVTAQDIEFSLALYAHPEVLWEDVWWGIDSVAVLDDRTVRLFYEWPADARNAWAVFYPKHLLEGLDPKGFYGWEFWTHPVGNGPYRYVRHVPKTMVELEANPDYFRGTPKVERVLFKFGGGTGLTELMSGGIDVLTWMNRAEILKVASDPRFRLYHHMWPGVPWHEAIYWNHRHPLFRDPPVRRALTLAIDRRELIRVLNMPDDLQVADVVYSGRQYRRGELPEPLPYDPGLAGRLLDGLGWREVGDDGIRRRNGKRMSFTALVPSGGVEREAAIYVQAKLRAVGVEMKLQPLDGNLVRRRLRSGNYEAALQRFYSGVPELKQRLVGEGSPLGWIRPRLSAIVDSVVQEPDPATEDRVYRAFWPAMGAEVPLTLLFPLVQTYAVHRRVRGLRSPFHGDPIQFMEELWVEDDGG
ncbi:MAG: ABC transporter substrate-binding protein [Gemmatimonadota bacterium]